MEWVLSRMKRDKAAGLDETKVEMFVVTGEVGVKWLCRLLSVCFKE